MRVCLAIDPSDHASGLAVFADDGGRCRYGGHRFAGCMASHATAEVDAHHDLRILLATTGLPMPGADCEWAVVIERDTNPNNRAAIESLAANRRIWRNVCLSVGVRAADIHEVAPQTWQGPCGLLGKTGKAMGGTKDASIALARQEFAIDPQTADESDAALMGGWWLQEGGAEAHRARAEARVAKRTARGSGRWTEQDLAEFRARR